MLLRNKEGLMRIKLNIINSQKHLDVILELGP